MKSLMFVLIYVALFLATAGILTWAIISGDLHFLTIFSVFYGIISFIATVLVIKAFIDEKTSIQN